MRILILIGVLLSACTINREPIKQKNKDQFLLGHYSNSERYIPDIPEN